MSRTRKLAFPVIIAVARLLSINVATAQMPSALVLEKKGTTFPEVQPYTEISVGKTITLSPAARIIFQHYYSCRTVTVAGGAIEFEAKAYFIKGGTKENETQTPCPKTVTLKAGGEAGGVLMRSMLSPNVLTLSTQPNFVLVGKRAHDFASVHVSREGRLVLKSPLDHRRFQWPAQSEALVVDTEYELALVPSAPGSVPVRNKFRASSSETAHANSGLILIRID